MTRRESRASAFFVVFEMALNPMDAEEALAIAEETGEPEIDDFSIRLVRAVYKHKAEIIETIKSFLKGWSVDRISKVSLSILQISCAQLLHWDEIADSDGNNNDELSENIIINEAVELAKLYGNEDDYSFVNGVLGSIVRSTPDYLND